MNRSSIKLKLAAATLLLIGASATHGQVCIDRPFIVRPVIEKSVIERPVFIRSTIMKPIIEQPDFIRATVEREVIDQQFLTDPFSIGAATPTMQLMRPLWERRPP